MENEVKVYKGAVAVDDRGQLSFVNDFNFDGVKRFYTVENHSVGFIRAWHGHQKEGKYVTVVSGAAIIGLVDLRGIKRWDLITQTHPLPAVEIISSALFETSSQVDDAPIHRFVISQNNPTVIWIPPGFVNGAKNLTENTRIMYFSTKSLGESEGDDYRYRSTLWGNVWNVEYR